jgi:isoleucyl-tRNA synthetase
VYILAWTTTPWTLPSNTALAVGDKITYVQVDTFNPYTYQAVSVILAKDLLEKYFNEKGSEVPLSAYKPGDKVIPFRLVQEFAGTKAVGLQYEQLMPYLKPLYDVDKAFRVVAGDFVTTGEGTGVVHTSPTFGADDFRVAKQNGIPPLTVRDAGGNELPVVDRKGKFVSEIGKQLAAAVSRYGIKTHRPLGADDFYVKNYTNENEGHPDYKSTDVILSIILKEENKAFRVEKYEHPYPHCWRTDKPVLYYPMDSWFIRTTAVKERMAELNRTINWKPESTGTGRFGNWLESLVDWNLSRSRFWGTPLPIWRTKDGKEEICIGSVEQLRSEIEKARRQGIANPPFDPASPEFDLHRPFVDEFVLVSPGGQPMYREPDLIDVWFDSGAMPFAQWHYPFENRDRVDSGSDYPADYIAEGVDQTRGWFFTLHAISVMVRDSVAFRNVISNGLVLDRSGNKMSKSKGNVVNPFDTIAKYGPDAVRWYMIENAPPWENLKFDTSGIEEVQRRFFGTLMNTYSFFALYANIDGFVKDEMDLEPEAVLQPIDKWILSKLQGLIAEVRSAFDRYEPTPAARAIQEFVNDHLSNWYVRLNRKRFWQPAAQGLSSDKKAAYETLFECLAVVAQLMSPVAPFFADWLYKSLTDNIRESARRNNTPLRLESVHLTRLVPAEPQRRNHGLERSMDYAQRICSLVHSIRKASRIKVRTPLQKVLLPVLDPGFESDVRVVEDIIRSEVNVKRIEYIDDTSGLVVKKPRPNFQKLGKQFGTKLKEVGAIIQGFTQEEIQALERAGQLAKGGYDFVTEDVLITAENIPGWSVASEGSITVALDITVTEELRREGIARDFVNRIQNLRKEKGFDVLDKITIAVARDSDVFNTALSEFSEYIRTETQASELSLTDSLPDGELVEMDEFNLMIRIGKKQG